MGKSRKQRLAGSDPMPLASAKTPGLLGVNDQADPIPSQCVVIHQDRSVLTTMHLRLSVIQNRNRRVMTKTKASVINPRRPTRKSGHRSALEVFPSRSLLVPLSVFLYQAQTGSTLR